MVKVEQIIWVIVLVLLACFGVTMSWTLAVCLMAGVALASVVTASVNWRVGGRRWDSWDSLSLGTLGYFGLRAYFSPVFDLAKEDMVFWTMGWLAFNAFRSRRLWSSATWALAVMVMLNFAYVLLQAFESSAVVPLGIVSELAMTAGAFGLFQDYGSFANAMAMAAVLGLAIGALGRMFAMWQRLVFVLLGLAAAWMCFQSDSRIGAVSLACAVAVLVVLSWFVASKFESEKRRSFRLAVLIIGVLSLLLSVLFVGQTLQKRDHRLAATGEGVEYNIRQKYWAMALEHGEHALIGTGARSYSYLSWESWNGILEGHQADPHFVHNEYLQTYLEYGVLGLFTLLGLLAALVWSSTRAILKAPLDSKRFCIRLAGLLIVLVTSVHCLTDFAMRIPINWVILCIALAWCVVQKPRGHQGKRQPRVGSCYLPMLVAGAALGLALNDLRAAIPLMQVRQVRDYPGWKARDPDLLLPAFTKANHLAPDFRRLQKIGWIHQSAYNSGDQGAFEACLAAYKECLSRHPENPEVNLKLANLYKIHGDYETAQEYFLVTSKYAEALSYHGSFFISWAENQMLRARETNRAKDDDSAMDLLHSLEKILMRSRYHKGKALELMRDSMISRLILSLVAADYESAIVIERELKEEIPNHIMRQKPALSYKRIGLAYLDAAGREWRDGKNERAKELYQVTLRYLNHDKSLRKGEEDVVRDGQIDLVKMILSQLR